MNALYAAGYAIPLYGPRTHTWRHYDREITLPHGAVQVTDRDGVPCALWADVQKAVK